MFLGLVPGCYSSHVLHPGHDLSSKCVSMVVGVWRQHQLDALDPRELGQHRGRDGLPATQSWNVNKSCLACTSSAHGLVTGASDPSAKLRLMSSPVSVLWLTLSWDSFHWSGRDFNIICCTICSLTIYCQSTTNDVCFHDVVKLLEVQSPGVNWGDHSIHHPSQNRVSRHKYLFI